MDLKHVICKESLFSSKRGEVYKAMDKAGVKSTQARSAARLALMTMAWNWSVGGSASSHVHLVAKVREEVRI